MIVIEYSSCCCCRLFAALCPPDRNGTMTPQSFRAAAVLRNGSGGKSICLATCQELGLFWGGEISMCARISTMDGDRSPVLLWSCFFFSQLKYSGVFIWYMPIVNVIQ